MPAALNSAPSHGLSEDSTDFLSGRSEDGIIGLVENGRVPPGYAGTGLLGPKP